MKKLLLFSAFVVGITTISPSFASPWYGIHPVTYPNPGAINIGPGINDRGTKCTDDGDGKKRVTNVTGTISDPVIANPTPIQNSYSYNSGLKNSVAVVAGLPMNCLYYDDAAPIVTSTAGSNLWQQLASKTITVTASDTGGSGIQGYMSWNGGNYGGYSKYSINNADCAGAGISFSSTANFTLSEGNWEVRVCAMDGAGNLATTVTEFFKLDNTQPRWSASYDLRGLTNSGTINLTMLCQDYVKLLDNSINTKPGILGAYPSGCDKATLLGNFKLSSTATYTTDGKAYYTCTCKDMDLNEKNSISYNNVKCGGNLTFTDIAGRSIGPATTPRDLKYSLGKTDDLGGTNTANDLSIITAGNTKILGLSQIKSSTGADSINKDELTYNNTVTDNFSKINMQELKVQIKKNVEILLKGLNRTTERGTDTINNLTDANTFKNYGYHNKTGNKEFVYINGKDVTIDCRARCTISGNKTIIIENGNLYIKSNIYNGSTSGSILGIIMLGNKTGAATSSQVYIDEKITNGAGIIYTDGSVQSTYDVGASDKNIYTAANVNNRGLNQLYWKGSFLSQNSVGGSVGPLFKCPYGTPEYNKSTCDLKTSKKYDLLLLRRYKLIDGGKYYGIISAPAPFSTTAVPLGIGDGATIKLAGEGNCSEAANIVSCSSLWPQGNFSQYSKLGFILNYDSGIATNTPLGFGSN